MTIFLKSRLIMAAFLLTCRDQHAMTPAGRGREGDCRQGGGGAVGMEGQREIRHAGRIHADGDRPMNAGRRLKHETLD